MENLLNRTVRRISSKRGIEIVAIGDYTAKDPGEASFSEGDHFSYISDKDGHWTVENDKTGEAFIAPYGVLVRSQDVIHSEWISSNLSRTEAHNILMDPKYPHGSFIFRIREEEAFTYSLGLSIKTQSKKFPYGYIVSRFKIKRNRGDFRIDTGSHSFERLTDLVEHYSNRSNTTNIALKYSVKKEEFVSKWEYSKNEVKEEKRLDKGDFGEVYLGKLNDREAVALKTPNPARMEPDEFMAEAEISRSCRHPNVLVTIGVCREKLFSISEYMKNGNLKKYLLKNKLSSSDCLSIARKISSAMEYLACMKIVHRDLAARNILVGETIANIKVADFGLARSLQESRYYITKKEAFPLGWTAPEGFVIYEGIVITKLGEVTSAADVWSFGVVLWELYTGGQVPYSDVAANDLYNELLKGWRLAKPSKCAKAVYDKMLECWNIDRKLRPDFTALRVFLEAEAHDEDAAAIVASSDADDDDGWTEEAAPEAGSTDGGFGRSDYGVYTLGYRAPSH